MDDQSADRASGSKRFRKLRIAWSLSWGILFLVLSVVCFVIHGQSEETSIMRRAGSGLTAISTYDGKVYFSWVPRVSYRPTWAGQINRYGVRYNVYSNGSRNITAPLWMVCVLFA